MKSPRDKVLHLIEEHKYSEAIDILKKNQTIVEDAIELETEILDKWGCSLEKQVLQNINNISSTNDIDGLCAYNLSYQDLIRFSVEYKITNITIDEYKKRIDNSYNEKIGSLICQEIKDIDSNDLIAFISNAYTDYKESYTLKSREIENVIRNIIGRLIEDGAFLNTVMLIKNINNIDYYRSKKLVSELMEYSIQRITQIIKESDSMVTFNRLEGAIRECKTSISPIEFVNFESVLESKKNALSLKGKNIEKEFIKHIEDKDLNKAKTSLEELKIFYGKEDPWQQIYSELEESDKKESEKRAYKNSLGGIYKLINCGLIDEARTKEEQIKKNPLCTDDDIQEIERSISEAIQRAEIENGLKSDQALPLHILSGFNIPKKPNAGEDADPLVLADNKTRWGLIGVFDGMGGSGASKYTDIVTGEEHTSAYWASRIVRECVKSLMDNRPQGILPGKYLEENLHKAIKDCLNNEIKRFNGVSTIKSKMIRRLPTTMALGYYYLFNDEIKICCYWAGDSRIYLLGQDSIYFLTKDDSDTDDPFAPENMDLAMNNTIYQDTDDVFRINKSVITLPQSEFPLTLIAATDGCFGYYKNPLLFENMLRRSILTSSNWDEIMNQIPKNIIENIQQDDFSMAIIAFGETDFSEFKENMSMRSNSELFQSFLRWYISYTEKEKVLKQHIAQTNNRIAELRTDDKTKIINSLKEDESILKQSIDSFRELLKKYNIDAEDQFSEMCNKWKSTQNSLESNKATILSEIAGLSEKLKEQKSKLENHQEEGMSANNSWYKKYRESDGVKFIEPNSSL